MVPLGPLDRADRGDGGAGGRPAGLLPFCLLDGALYDRWLRNRVRWPALALRVEEGRSVSCKICTRNCPMSLDVVAMVLGGKLGYAECILCGTCVETCPKDVIRHTFRRGAR